MTTASAGSPAGHPAVPSAGPSERARALDAADPLAHHRDAFAPAPGVVAYLDGNSLGRPLTASLDAIARVTREEWAGRLIRGWDEGWLDLPLRLGDALGAAALGAAPGQTVFADSTTVLLDKIVRAALDLRPDRDEIIASRDDFPTDRYVIARIAEERGLTLRWVDTADETTVLETLGERTALVVLSMVNYRTGALADRRTIEDSCAAWGALILWDLCHVAGVIPARLDHFEADFAVGCSYKYLNGGPGAPAFAYVAERHLAALRNPIPGWMGSARPFEMGASYEPADGIRRMLSGTPPIVGLAALEPAIALVADAGIDAIHAKSVALTSFALDLVDELLPDVVTITPRDPHRRGGHVTIEHASFEAMMPDLWARGVIPDFRRPAGIRLGLSPLSTSFAEVEVGVRAIADRLR